MKNILLITTAFVSLTLAFLLMSNRPTAEVDFSYDPAGGVQFLDGTLAEAQAQAKAEHKMVFVDLYAPWCSHCKRLKATGLADTEVGALYNNSFVNIALDGEKEGAALMKTYKIKGFPALLYFDENGKLLTKEIGYQSSKDLIEIAQDLIAHGGK